MKLLLDTNVIIDILSKREGYETSLQVLRNCEIGSADGVVSAITVNDAMYILRKHVTPSTVRDAVMTLLVIVEITDVTKSDITGALASEMRDYEDAVQAECAKRIRADYIVTHNLRDFEKSPIRAISPEEILELM
jgi:predicted nucleic acid-binding protein